MDCFYSGFVQHTGHGPFLCGITGSSVSGWEEGPQWELNSQWPEVVRGSGWVSFRGHGRGSKEMERLNIQAAQVFHWRYLTFLQSKPTFPSFSIIFQIKNDEVLQLPTPVLALCYVHISMRRLLPAKSWIHLFLYFLLKTKTVWSVIQGQNWRCASRGHSHWSPEDVFCKQTDQINIYFSLFTHWCCFCQN